MESPVRNSLWWVLRADSDEARRARGRLGVGLALALLVSGLLTAVGLAIVVFASSLAVVTFVAGMGVFRAVRRNRLRLKQSACAAVTAGYRTSSRESRRAATVLRTQARRLFHASVARGSCVRGSTLRWSARCLEHSRHTWTVVRTSRIDVQREALRLNAAGTRHRRNGAHAKAIELHERALDLLRETQDSRAVALTQNNLALALSHSGRHREATALFEQAAATVGWLGDQEHEGRIMANLALAHRRQGRLEQSEDVLRVALTKLRQDSTAYKRVEAELSAL
jgi:tetratricopeptide (TPR) repeat protein